jgi:hypothetical protein
MKTLIKLALISWLWIMVINTGTLHTGDTQLRLQMAHAWWTGTEEVAPDYQPSSWFDMNAGVKGVGGRRYLFYEVGQSLLMLPGDWLGTQLHQWFPKVGSQDLRHLVVNFSTFVPLNVAAVVSCFWLLKLFNFEERLASLASLVWLLGTTVLHYAQVHQQNNQVLLFVAIGYASALACVLHERPRLAVLSGLAVGAAFLLRATSIIHVLTVLLFLAGCVVYQSRSKLKTLKILGLWIAGFIPLAVLGRVFDYMRYGSFWTTGQSLWVQQLNTNRILAGLPELPANFPFTNPPQVGILGVLFSPAKSIFIYDPLLLPCLVLAFVFWKRLSPYIQLYLIAGFLNLGLHIALTSRLDFWHGDSAWGARYHVTSVHLLLIPLVAVFVQSLLSARKLTAWLMRGILAVAILVQIASVAMPLYLEEAQARTEAPASSLSGWDYSSYLNRFRLGQRATNIICLIDSSFSERCISRLNPEKTNSIIFKFNQVFLLPFNYAQFKLNRKWTFFGWGLALTLAIIGTTFWLIRPVLKKRYDRDTENFIN